MPYTEIKEAAFQEQHMYIKKGEQKEKKCELMRGNITEQNSECTSISPRL